MTLTIRFNSRAHNNAGHAGTERNYEVHLGTIQFGGVNTLSGHPRRYSKKLMKWYDLGVNSW